MTFKEYGMKATLILALCLSALPALAGSATSARLDFNFEEEGTHYSYKIPVQAETMRTVDRAIFSGSFLGFLEASRIKTDDTVDKKVEDRTAEISQIAGQMAREIAVTKVADLEVGSPSPMPVPTGPAAQPIPLPSSPKFQAANEKLTGAETNWANGSFEAAFHAMGELSPFFASVQTAPSEELLPLLVRWQKLRAQAVSDGLLLLPSTGGKRVLAFKTQRDRVEGRGIRHVANLALLKGLGAENEIWGLLMFVDEYAPEEALNLRDTMLNGQSFAAVKSALIARPAFREMRTLLLQVNPELRPLVIEQMIADFVLKREPAWPEIKTMFMDVLNRLIAEES